MEQEQLQEQYAMELWEHHPMFTVITMFKDH